ncbi:MAG: VOC family protein [Planctomycetota bacterium]|nr:MAG: VOC family protein [Planctomycetota bacterium]
MLHHVSFPVADIEKAALLYEAILGALGYRQVDRDDRFVGYGVKDGEDQFALKLRNPAIPAGPGFHLAFAAPSRAAVVAFHEQAMKYGARDNGAPGLRPHYGPHYFAAFVIDLDGHYVEAVYNQASAT